jgi:sugar phosphate isomerase/epimerase
MGLQKGFRMNIRRSTVVFVVAMALTAARSAPADGPGGPLQLANPFFAFDNGVGRGTLDPTQQAAILADLGYAGIGYSGTRNIPAVLKALDARGLKLFSIYVGSSVDLKKPKFDPGLPEAIRQLRGRDTIIWLNMMGGKASGTASDERAVAIVDEVADLAAAAQLRVVLYPHVGMYVARVEDAVRIVKQAGRKNLGVSLNLCHWLKLDQEANLPERLREAMPYLMLVSINGADHQGDWTRLIQTLDRGEFDVYGFLKTLRREGYTGPIGLQGYMIKGDPRENLRRSMDAWRKFVARMAAGS